MSFHVSNAPKLSPFLDGTVAHNSSVDEHKGTFRKVPALYEWQKYVTIVAKMGEHISV